MFFSPQIYFGKRSWCHASERPPGLQGNGGYIEEFMASLAAEEKLDVVSMPFAEWEGQSWHCCMDAGTKYY